MKTETISCLVAVFLVSLFMVKGNPAPQDPAPQDPVPQASPPFDPAPNHPQSGGGSVDGLSAGYEGVVGEMKPGFICDQKLYGYYADPLNDCKVFHVCLPIKQAGIATVYKQWSFFCNNQTLFNQEKFVCDRPENVDCSKAENFYSLNAGISQPPDQ